MSSKSFLEVFQQFIKNPKLTGTYAEPIYKHFILLDQNPPLGFKAGDFSVLLGLPVTKDILNLFGSPHGGALATILDTSTTLAILKADKKRRKTVSAQLNINFLNPAKLDDFLLIQADCTRVGKTLAFSEAKIYTQEPFRLISNGSHIKAIIDEAF